MFYKRNYSDLGKTIYLLKMSNASIKCYYHEDKNYLINTDGISKNGSVLKLNNSLYCVANLDDIMLRTLNRHDFNYKNINLIDHKSLNNLNIDKNIGGNTLIQIIGYNCIRTNKKFLIISSHDSIGFYEIILNNILLKYIHKFKYVDINRKIEIYDEYLYTLSHKAIDLIPLYDISNEFLGTEIEILKGIDENGYNVPLLGSNIKIDKNRKLLYIFNIDNKSNIYIYSLDKPYNPKFINNYEFDNDVQNLLIIELSKEFLNNIYFETEENVNNFIIVSTKKNNIILNTNFLINLEYLGKNKNNKDIDNLYKIIYLKDNIFLTINENNSNLVFLELKSIASNDEDQKNRLELSWIKTIKLDNFSTINDIYFSNDILYILNNTKGFHTYKFIYENGSIILENNSEIDSFGYYKNSDKEGAKSHIILDNMNYLIDSYNGLIIFEDGNDIKEQNLDLSNKIYDNSSDYLKLPKKIFIHMAINTNIDSEDENYVDFESKILAIDTKLKLVLFYVPYYILQLSKPFSIENNIKYDKTIKNFSYGININYPEAKKSYTEITILTENYEVYTPLFGINSVKSYNHSKFGNSITTNNINLSGCVVVNENNNINSFINFNSNSTIDIDIIKKFYSEYNNMNYLNNMSTVLFKSFGINDENTFIINKFDSSNNNRIIYFLLENDKYIFIVKKSLLPNIEYNIIYKVIDFNNKFIGFTVVKSYSKIELLESNIPSEYLNNEYIYLSAFFRDELLLLNQKYENIFDNIEMGNLYFIREPLQYNNNLYIDYNYSYKILKNIHLNIDIINVELLNSKDINLIINSNTNFSRYNINNFLDYKNRIGKGYMITNISKEFQIINTNKLILGDIIIKINNENDNDKIISNIMYKSKLNIEYYRLVQNNWIKNDIDIDTLTYDSEFNNLII